MRSQVSSLFLYSMTLGFLCAPINAQDPAQSVNSLGTSVWQNYDPVGNAWSGNSPVDRLAIEIGTIGLAREEPDDQLLAIDQNSAPLLDANELQGDLTFGLKANLDVRNVRPWYGGTDLQLGYFGINSMDAGRTANANQINYIFFNSFPVTQPSTINYHYSSNIYSAETNLRFSNGRRVRPLVGLRYFKLEDTFNAFNFGSGSVSQIGGFSLTNNSLFGGQFGAELDVLQVRRWNVYSFGKVGLMSNRIEGSAWAADSGGNAVIRNYNDSNFATLVDVGVGAHIRIAGPLSLKVGYHTLFASKVALGVDQNNSVNLLSSAGDVDLNSQQWHGLDIASVWEF
jgi:Putative beta barrel porin-7 (BBP7)